MPSETLLTSFDFVQPAAGNTSTITLRQTNVSPAFAYTYTLIVLSPTSLITRLSSPTRPLPLHNNTHPSFALSPLPLPTLTHDPSTKHISFSLPTVHIHLDYSTTPCLTVTCRETREWVYRDRRGASYYETAEGMHHYMSARGDDVYMGLGEKGAPVNLAKRRFAMKATNAAGYDAYRSDPLYKHQPLLLTLRPPTTSPSPLPLPAHAHFYTGNVEGTHDLQCWHNDPSGAFTLFGVEHGGLEEWVGWGASGKEVQGLWWREVVGELAIVPRWWFGYIASTMGNAEQDDAQSLLLRFPPLCASHGIPCSAMQLSSGYTVDPRTKFRSVFYLNTSRYPDFEGFLREYHRWGIKVTANIKPYMTTKHREYDILKQGKALFSDGSGPSLTHVWAGLWDHNEAGSWIDFTSKAGREWWYSKAVELMEYGIDSTWNDDNETRVTSDAHTCAWDLPEGDFARAGEQGLRDVPVGLSGRILNAQLMCRVSREATEKVYPERRPFVLTRSLNIGALHYASSSWSGDNHTSWKTMRGNVPMGLNASVAGCQIYGDDIGGFVGPLPTPELFLRWIQMSIYRPRFCIHSFKPTKGDLSGRGRVNEPWMYPEVLPEIRAAIKRRYELIPYLYGLHWEAMKTGQPMNVWPGWGEFERDAGVYEEEVLEGSDFWFGAGKVLVAGCFYPGTTNRKVYLPTSGLKEEVYYNLNAPYTCYPAGQTVTVATPYEHIAIFARSGAVIPIGKPCVTCTVKSGVARTIGPGAKAFDIPLKEEGGIVELDDWRGAEIFPLPKESGSSEWMGWQWHEDDGESKEDGLPLSVLSLRYRSVASDVEVEAKWLQKGFQTLWATEGIWVFLPHADHRVISGAKESNWCGDRKAWLIDIT